MPERSLKAYISYVAGRLDSGRYGEVKDHARHILEKYPKYIEAYKLLGRALLKEQKYQDALDVFQRVLSTDPNNFDAHVGMSESYRETGALDAAIWHLERAYEQVPGSRRVEEELIRLIEQHTGKRPRRVARTSGLLARLYLNGKHYAQAIAELRKALQKDDERFDLQVLLANALWLAREQVEAGKVAADVLKRLPYSLDANRILAQLWMMANEVKEARPFLVRLKELDPYLAYEIEQGHKPPENAFMMQVLDLHEPTPPPPEAVADTDWLDSIDSVDKQRGVTGQLDPGALAGIFDDMEEELGGTAPLNDSPRSGPPAKPPEPPPVDPDEPDWLRDVLMGETAPEVSDAPRPTPGEPVTDDSPDWLRDVLGLADEQSPPPPPSQPEPEQRLGTGSIADSVGVEGYDTQEMLHSLGFEDGEGNPQAPPTPITPADTIDEDLPDWLDDLSFDSTGEQPPATDEPEWFSEALEKDKAEGDTDTDLPDWLEDAPEQTPSSPSQAVPDEPQQRVDEPPADESAPDWLTPLPSTPVPDDLSFPSDPAQEPMEQTTPDWLQDAVANEPKPSTKELPDWLGTAQEMGAADQSKKPEAAAPEEDTEMAPPDNDMFDDSDVPDWLTEGNLDDEDAALAWLSEIAAKYDPDFGKDEETEAEAPATTESAGGADDDLPDWLSDATPAAEAGGGDDLPDWLSDMGEDSPPAAQAAPPTPPAPDPVPTAPDVSDDELPDWLSGMGDEPTPEPAAASADDDLPAWLSESAAGAEADDDLPDWLSEGEAAPAASMGTDDDLPDWLRDEEPAAPTSAVPPEPDPVPNAPDVSDDELPDWLSGMGDEPTPEPAAASADDDLPDWLRDEEPAAPTPVAPPTPEPEPAPQPTASTDDDLPDWLSSEEPAAPPTPPEPEPAPQPTASTDSGLAAADEDIPDWLSSGDLDDEDAALAWLNEIAAKYDPDFDSGETAAVEQPATPAPQPTAEADDDLPDWLSDEETAAPAQAEPAAMAASPAPDAPADTDDELDLPSWLRPTPTEPMEPVQAVDEDEDLPEWLREPQEEPEPTSPALAPDRPRAAVPPEEPEPEVTPMPGRSAMAWLDGQVASQGVDPTEVISEALTPDKPPVREMPHIPDPEAKAVEADEEDLPEWMREIDESELVDEDDDLLFDLDLDEIEADESALDAALASDTLQLEPQEAEPPTPAPAPVEEPPTEEPATTSTGLTGYLETDEPAQAEAEQPEPVSDVPDWLSDGGSDEGGDDLSAFLRSVDEPEPEPATQVPEPAVSALPPAPEPEVAPPAPEPAQPEEQPALSGGPRTTSQLRLPDLSRLPVPDGESGQVISFARQKIENAQFDEGLNAYESLISRRAELDQVVVDLNELIRQRPSARARRVLGDALMMQGNLQEALEIYRSALDEL